MVFMFMLLPHFTIRIQLVTVIIFKYKLKIFIKFKLTYFKTSNYLTITIITYQYINIILNLYDFKAFVNFYLEFRFMAKS